MRDQREKTIMITEPSIKKSLTNSGAFKTDHVEWPKPIAMVKANKGNKIK